MFDMNNFTLSKLNTFECIERILTSYSQNSINNLTLTTKLCLCTKLNHEIILISTSAMLQDWRGLASQIGFNTNEIDNIKTRENPTLFCFKSWHSSDANILTLLQFILNMKRFDILEDDEFLIKLENDCTSYSSQQLRLNPAIQLTLNPNESNKIPITQDDVVNNFTTFYDAFLCVCPEDYQFASLMVKKLESDTYKIKLCYDARDLLAGTSQLTVTAELIQSRCKRMVAIISPNFVKNSLLQFFTEFTLCLSPGSRMKKIIPVLFEKCNMPPILNSITYVDYTRKEIREFFWPRLAASIKADLHWNPAQDLNNSSNLHRITMDFDQVIKLPNDLSDKDSDNNSLCASSDESAPSNKLEYSTDTPSIISNSPNKIIKMKKSTFKFGHFIKNLKKKHKK